MSYEDVSYERGKLGSGAAIGRVLEKLREDGLLSDCIKLMRTIIFDWLLSFQERPLY